MKKSLLTLMTLLCLSFSLFSEAAYVPGYYITNQGEKVNCLVKNQLWDSNMSTLCYKHFINAPEQNHSVEDIKAFGYEYGEHYEKHDVYVNKSSQLSTLKVPVYKQETLFLRVLVSKQIALLEYYAEGIIKYFLKNGSEVVQLVNHSYLNGKGKVESNEFYKEQLFDHLNYDKELRQDIKSLDYSHKAMVRFFENYSSCDSEQSL